MNLLLILLCATSCEGQKSSPENYLHFDAWKHINTKYLSVTVMTSKDKEMYIPYYEFNMSNIKIGEASLFAVYKTYSEEWLKETAKKECSENRNAYQAICCLAERMFSTDTTFLKNEMDLYLFFVDKKELDGPMIEEAEGGTVKSYYPKKGSTYLIYKYINDKWKEVDRIKQEGTDIPRNFGMDYIEKIAIQKMD